MNNRRLNPRWFDANYYGLVQLRNTISYVVDKYFAQLPKDASLLDYGCGTMPYKQLYLKRISSYSGADIVINPNRSIDIDKESSRILVEDSKFDVVVSTQVLEHVESPSSYLREAHRVSKGGAILVVSTHGIFPYHPDPNDYWRWTASGLDKILKDNGWQPLEIIGIIGSSAAAISLFQYSVSKHMPGYLRAPFEVLMQRFVWLVDLFSSRRVKVNDSVIYLAVARNDKTK